MSRRVPLERRFWSKVDKSAGDSGCWLWMAARNARGYGCVGRDVGRGYWLAHRVSWELANGPIPDGLFVLHRCDVPSCVNPHHLFVGTNADNMRDMALKGRGRGAGFHVIACRYGHARTGHFPKGCPVCGRLRDGGFWPQFLASSSDERRWLSAVVMSRPSRGDSAAA